MTDPQDVFTMSGSTPLLTSLKEHSSSVLRPSASFHFPEPMHTVSRSRQPLSDSDASALNNILRRNSRSCESGFFSDSPGISTSSLHQFNELQPARLHGSNCFPEQDELDEFNRNKLSPLFNEFAEELGGCWKEAGRYLLKKTCSVENIDADYSKVSEKAYQTLMKWKEENADNASVIELFKCFNHIGKEDVADKILPYLPKRIAKACEWILLSSPKKIRRLSMVTVICNIKETVKEMTVEKQLRIVGSDGEECEVYLCVSETTGRKYIIMEVEEVPSRKVLAARLAIPKKHFVDKKKKLRRTADFLKDIKIKEDTVKRLMEIVEKLQPRLEKDYFRFCKEDLNCTNCEKTKTKLELLEKELSLVHHTLGKMMRDSRRLSFTGIQTERISNLADRTYGICEDHKKMHSEITKAKRRCSLEFLDVEEKKTEKGEEAKEESDVEDPLTECTMNFFQHFTRGRQVVQSVKPKRRKETKAVQRNKSDKSKTRSRFYVSIRQSFLNKREKKGQATPSGLTRTDSKKTKGSFKSKDSKVITRRVGLTEKTDLTSLHQRSNTSPATLVRRNGDKTDFVGPEELDLDDLEDAGTLSFRVQGVKVSGQLQPPRDATPRPTGLTSTHKKVHKCNSDPYVRNVKAEESRNTPNLKRDSHGDAVFDILRQEYHIRKGRSYSDAQLKTYRQNRDQVAKSLGQKRDKSSMKSQSDSLELFPSDKPSQKRDKSSNNSQSDSLELFPSEKPSQKREKSSTDSKSDLRSSSDENNNAEETTSEENVKWLKDVDTENIIFV